MATYITTLKFTHHGVQDVGESTKRFAAFKSTAKKLGAKVINAYWTLGSVDGILIFEAPDDETATAAMLHLSKQGNMHTSTMRAFNASEFETIVAKLG